MFLVGNYTVAVLFCVVTMLCWGSWGNTQKAVGKTWRFELFYWDYVLGIMLMSFAFAFTFGSWEGGFGRGFLADIQQASPSALGWAFTGGVVFNIANVLLVAAIAIAGMSVAFPVGIGLALVLGVILNYIWEPSGNQALLFGGVGLVALAIILNAVAYSKLPASQEPGASKSKGLLLAVVCGILMALWNPFLVKSLAKVELPAAVEASAQVTTLDLNAKNAAEAGAVLQAGQMTPYTANVVFSLGVLACTIVLLPILMYKPIVGEPVSLGRYFTGGTLRDHTWGIVGGFIWAIGTALNVSAAGTASPAVAYGLGQGATLIAAIWGVFIWREFQMAPKGVGKINAAMFLFFVIGLAMIIFTKM